MKIRIISFTEAGSQLNKKLCDCLTDKNFECTGFTMERFAKKYSLNSQVGELKEWTKETFLEAEGIIFISACGIAVRAIAPFIKNKFLDPAVLSMDEQGKYCIPLLSGHIGGANELAVITASMMGGTPVITTATDINNCFAVDVFAHKNQLIIADRELAKRVSSELLEGKKVFMTSEMPEYKFVSNEIVSTKEEATSNLEIQISTCKLSKEQQESKKVLQLIPTNLIMGIGCKKNIDGIEMEQFIEEKLANLNIDKRAITIIASIDIKKNEKAILYIAKKFGWKFKTYSSDELKQAEGEFTESEFVSVTTGVGNVCERAAVLAGTNGTLLMGKTVGHGMTLAIAKDNRRISFE